MDELRNNPQIIELLETLEENGMQKEKGEVSALVSYIGDMEHTLVCNACRNAENAQRSQYDS